MVQAVAVASLGPLAPKRMETCPAARGGLKSDAAAHSLHALFDNGEADARAFIFGRAQALEDPENPVLMFWCDTDPVVFDPEPHNAIGSLGAEADVGVNAGRNELERVAQ